MNVLEQGQVVVNSAAVHAQSPDGAIACVCVDLAAKYAECDSYGDQDDVPIVYFDWDENTTNLNESYPDIATLISFPEYEGYEIFAVSGPFRYTFNIVFVRKQ